MESSEFHCTTSFGDNSRSNARFKIAVVPEGPGVMDIETQQGYEGECPFAKHHCNHVPSDQTSVTLWESCVTPVLLRNSLNFLRFSRLISY